MDPIAAAKPQKRKKNAIVTVGLILSLTLCGVVLLADKAREKLSVVVVGYLLRQRYSKGGDASEDIFGKRLLQDVPCNTLIDTLSIDNIGTTAHTLLQERLAAPDIVVFTLDTFLVPIVLAQLKYDVQLWKVCGRCSDFEDDTLYPKDVGCRPQDYGYEAMHSGLLVAPYDVTTGEIIPGTLPVNIMPSYSFFPPSLVRPPLTSDDDHPAIVGILLCSISKSYALLPDDIGYGESAEFNKGFLLKQSAITSFVPLLWQAENLISNQTDCSSAMADAYSINGYSQSGYGAVVIGDALHRMGRNVVDVRAGGVPYKFSSETITHFIGHARDEKPPMTSYFMPIVAASLSTTNTDAQNFGQGQDFLANHWRDTIVEFSQSPTLRADGMKRMIPADDPLDIYNPDLIDIVLEGFAVGDTNACVTRVTNTTDKLCAAFQHMDLIEEIRRAQYPLRLCHARGDFDIPVTNLPDADINPTHVHIRTVPGTHAVGAVPCIFETVWAGAMPGAFKPDAWKYPEEKTLVGGCDVGVPPVAISRSCGLWRFLGFC